jgi:hypothetical protein
MAGDGRMLGPGEGGELGDGGRGSGCGGYGFEETRTTASLRPVRWGDLAASVVARKAVSGDGSGGMRRGTLSWGGLQRGDAARGAWLAVGRKTFAVGRSGVGMAEEEQRYAPGGRTVRAKRFYGTSARRARFGPAGGASSSPFGAGPARPVRSYGTRAQRTRFGPAGGASSSPFGAGPARPVRY